MKTLIFSLLLVTSSSSFAQGLTCLDKLLNFNRSSGVHQLEKEEWSDGKDTLDAESALAAYNSLVGTKLMCEPSEIKVAVSPLCNFIQGDLEQSKVCFLFTNIGYFIVSKDKSKTVNFIFSKDKKFQD